MSYRGMGQSIASVAPASAPNWARIERFARDAAGPAWGRFERAAARAQRAAGHTAALVSLSETIAVRPLATKWLSMPAQKHRDGLLEIADFARSSARAALLRAPAPPPPRAMPVRAPVPSTPARPTTMVVAAPRTPARSGGSIASGAAATARAASGAARAAARAPGRVSARRENEDVLVAVRAELAKPPQAMHRDVQQLLPMVDRAVADRGALRAFLARLVPSVTGDARVALALLVVRLEQADSARGTRPASSPPPAVSPPVVAPSQGGSTSLDAGWAAYQASELVRQMPGMARAQHDEFWSSLTEAERLAGLRVYGMTNAQLQALNTTSPGQADPTLVSFVGKMGEYIVRQMAQSLFPQEPPSSQSSGPLPQEPPSSQSSGPVSRLLGIGNYV